MAEKKKKFDADPDLIAMGDRFKGLRGKEKQWKIAKESGFQRSTICEIETGNKNLRYTGLVKLARFYGMTVRQFFNSDLFGPAV